MTDGVLRRPDVGLDLAERIVAGTRAEAESRGIAMGIAVVDRGGLPVVTARMDGAQIPAVAVSAYAGDDGVAWQGAWTAFYWGWWI